MSDERLGHRVLPMLDALQEELRWQKRVLTEEEFRELTKTICGNAGRT